MKVTNPKDMIGQTKLSMSLVPRSGVAIASLAFLEGAAKYGAYNWRRAGVKTSVYVDAMQRHLAKFWDGEDCDPSTGIPHTASIIACAMILIDADACGMLTDDRPPKAPTAALIDGLVPAIAHIKSLFKDKDPHHHTETDGLFPDGVKEVADADIPRMEEFRAPVAKQPGVIGDEALDELRGRDVPKSAVASQGGDVEVQRDEATNQIDAALNENNADYIEPGTVLVSEHFEGGNMGQEVTVVTTQEFLEKTGRKTLPFDGNKGFPYRNKEGGYGWGLPSQYERKEQ